MTSEYSTNTGDMSDVTSDVTTGAASSVVTKVTTVLAEATTSMTTAFAPVTSLATEPTTEEPGGGWEWWMYAVIVVACIIGLLLLIGLCVCCFCCCLEFRTTKQSHTGRRHRGRGRTKHMRSIQRRFTTFFWGRPNTDTSTVTSSNDEPQEHRRVSQQQLVHGDQLNEPTHEVLPWQSLDPPDATTSGVVDEHVMSTFGNVMSSPPTNESNPYLQMADSVDAVTSPPQTDQSDTYLEMVHTRDKAKPSSQTDQSFSTPHEMTSSPQTGQSHPYLVMKSSNDSGIEVNPKENSPDRNSSVPHYINIPDSAKTSASKDGAAGIQTSDDPLQKYHTTEGYYNYLQANASLSKR